MAGIVNLSGAAYSFVPFNSHIPDAKACVVSVFDYDSNITYSLDLTSTVVAAQLKHGIQSMYMDGSQMYGGQLTVQVAGSNQSFTINGGQSAYFPITIVGQNIFTISATSNGDAYAINPKISIIFYNVPFTTQVWDANALARRDECLGSNLWQITPASGFAPTITIINAEAGLNAGFITRYNFTVMPSSISTVISLQMFLVLNHTTYIDTSGWMLGPMPSYNSPMKGEGLNVALGLPNEPVSLTCFLSLSSALTGSDHINIYWSVWGQLT